MALKKYQNQNHIFKSENEDQIKQAEEYFLLKSFAGLPIDIQKQILGFSKIDPFDKKIPDSKEEAEYRKRLRDKGYIEFNAIIITDN